MVEVTKPILSVSCLSEHGIGTHRAREPFAYEQEIHKIPGNSCARAGDSQKSCVRAEGSQKLCVRAEDSRTSCVRTEGWQNSQRSCGASKRDDAFVQPVVEDPVDADRVPVETGAEQIPIPCEPSESEKMRHELTHIPLKPWCTPCVKGKAQSEPHKRIERTIEDSEVPIVQCDYFVLKNNAASDGLKGLNMYVNIVWVRHICGC